MKKLLALLLLSPLAFADILNSDAAKDLAIKHLDKLTSLHILSSSSQQFDITLESLISSSTGNSTPSKIYPDTRRLTNIKNFFI